MDKLNWIKELVRAEQEMEESGMVDFSAGFDPDRALLDETMGFMGDLKAAFVESSSAFNQLKGSTVGRIKIYGISNTEADFMLFRNGFKLVFSAVEPGLVAIRFIHIGSTFIPGQSVEDTATHTNMTEDILESHWGAFGDLIWAYKGQPVKLDYLVRYYLSRFIRESAK